MTKSQKVLTKCHENGGGGVNKNGLCNRLIINNIGGNTILLYLQPILMTIANKDTISNYLVSLYCKFSVFCVKKGVFL